MTLFRPIVRNSFTLFVGKVGWLGTEAPDSLIKPDKLVGLMALDEESWLVGWGRGPRRPIF